MNVLIPTDFTTTAYNAFKIALKLNKISPIHIYLLHVDKKRAFSNGKVTHITCTDSHDQKFHTKFNQHIIDLQNMAEVEGNHSIQMDGLLSHHNLLETIFHVIETQNIDMVILGTKARSVFTSVINRSPMYKIFSKAKIPTLLVPPEINLYEDISKISFSTDFSANSYKAMHWILQFSKDQQIDVSSFNISKNINTHQNEKWNLFFQNQIKFHKPLVKESYTNGVCDIFDRCMINLIACIIPESPSILYYMKCRKVRKLLRKKNIPILGIPACYLNKLPFAKYADPLK